MTASYAIVAGDIGGTHARFAIATLKDGRVAGLDHETVLHTADFATLESAWRAYGQQLGQPLPADAAIAVACPVGAEVLKLTNNPWVIRPSILRATLALQRLTLVNDFAAVAHAVAQVGPEHLRHLCGPERPLPDTGMISVIGPGTGLGVSALLRTGGGYHVIPSEGGHMDFAPVDSIEDSILQRLRARHVRVSVERIVSGPGLASIYEALAAVEKRAVAALDDRQLWTVAIDGSDRLAAAALDRLLLRLGCVAGDLALALGASAVVIAGGLGLRLADRLPTSGFRQRFVAKGRFEKLMSSLPVKLITHPQPGLLGAAAAFAAEYSPQLQ
jgi:glucokinase